MSYLIVRDGRVTHCSDLPEDLLDEVASDDALVVRKHGGQFEYLDSEAGWCDVEADDEYE